MKSSAFSAGAVVVRKTPKGPLYLLLRAYRFWDFPKGIVEEGESPLQAAHREVIEETGITDLKFGEEEQFAETAPYDRGKIVRYYLAQTFQDKLKLPISSQLERPEHHEYRWLSYLEARKLLVPRIRKILDWAHGLMGTSTFNQ